MERSPYNKAQRVGKKTAKRNKAGNEESRLSLLSYHTGSSTLLLFPSLARLLTNPRSLSGSWRR